MQITKRVSVLVNAMGLYLVLQYNTDGSITYYKDKERSEVFDIVLDLSMQNRINHYEPPIVRFLV